MGEGHDDLLTQEEVAARLKVTVRTVVRLQHDGVIPFILLGKSVRFFWPTVVSHLNANSTVCRSLRRATGPAADKGGRL
jgi:excisionase family DNA binding protein